MSGVIVCDAGMESLLDAIKDEVAKGNFETIVITARSKDGTTTFIAGANADAVAETIIILKETITEELEFDKEKLH